MFKATYNEKESSQIVTIYDVTYDNCGYPEFLFYYDGQWLRKSAKFFIPIQG